MRKTRTHPPQRRAGGAKWLRDELHMVDAALDAIGAPTEVDGVTLSPAGRIRAFASSAAALDGGASSSAAVSATGGDTSTSVGRVAARSLRRPPSTTPKAAGTGRAS